MSDTFGTVTLVGVGLLGGSIGLGLKARNRATVIRGIGSRPSSLETAQRVGAIEEIHTDWAAAVSGADLVILCTPPAVVIENLDTLRPLCGKQTVVTDVASTKAEICARVRKNWSDPYRFVGSHPMAGSEKSGPEHADANLFEDTVTFVEEFGDHAQDAYETTVALWECLGSKVQTIEPKHHDRVVAKTSHVPHVLASLIARIDEEPEHALPFIGKGYRDATRIAEGRAEVWRDICLTNADAIQEHLEITRERLNAYIAALESRDGATLQNLLEAGVQARRDTLDS